MQAVEPSSGVPQVCSNRKLELGVETDLKPNTQLQVMDVPSGLLKHPALDAVPP